MQPRTAPPLWTTAEIASVTGGRLIGGDLPVMGISIDTRETYSGDVFIALKGPQFDGHDFAAKAVENGASCVLVARDCNLPCQIIVSDTFAALNDLGAGGRARSAATIFAVTGSVGKTTTKEILGTLLTALDKTHVAKASLNNHWGVPLSLARMPADCAYGVFEIGMNHAGEITPLSRLVSPHVAIITNIAPVHIEHLKTIENIALAKAEIFRGMDAAGIAILPRDSEQFSLLLAEARTQGVGHIKTFGLHPEADARLIEVKPSADGLMIEAILEDEIITFRLGLNGAHHALNALAVLMGMKAAGCDIKTVLPRLAEIKPVSGRGNRFSVTRPNGDRIMVIDETHNASPIAVEAALSALKTITSEGRRIAVLGDMLELGENSALYHAGLKKAVIEAEIDMVLASGKWMAHLAEALGPTKSLAFPDSTTLADRIETLIQPGDILLVKGSRGARMRLVVDALKRMGQIEEQPSADDR